jgi:hypothetical protein
MNRMKATRARVAWSASASCYSQRRLMLWADVPTQAADAGRRFMPPVEPSAGMQPGRERPHSPRWVGGPTPVLGVAHVPAASIGSSSDSARHSPVFCTGNVRPTFTAPIAAETAPDRCRHCERISA